MERTDEALLAAFRAGDERALAKLLERHAPAIFRFGVKMCRDPEDAKDVMQDTLLAAARGLREFRGASSLTTWLYTVARSFCIKKRRKPKGAPANVLGLNEDEAIRSESPEVPPDEAAAGREIGVALQEAIAELDPESREVVVLRDMEGLSAAEVAEVTGTSVAAVKSRLHRARAAVRAKLEPMLEGRRVEPAVESTCLDVVALLSRFIEGEIGKEECAAMEQHVANCKRCGAACDSLERTLALCRSEASGEVPPEVQALVRGAVRAVIHDVSR